MSGLGIDWGLVTGAAAFAVVLGLGWGWRQIRRFARGLWRRAFRARQARRGYQKTRSIEPEGASPVVLTRFWVIDGDTIRDIIRDTTYRLENIDCPETDERAKCYRERKQGERAKYGALRILQSATRIEARPTGRIDKYRRSIAFFDIDGRDFGELMIERGFARPWTGQPQVWCGRDGGLEMMAKACAIEFGCKTCGAGAAKSSTVIEFPVVHRRTDDPP
jgi:endonuclease YncB( thermonuclease family)